MRICWRRVGIASTFLLIFSVELRAAGIEVDVFALMAGKCTTLKITERDFACTSVAFSHSPGGRSGFTVPLNDPDDDSHIITFSGENAKRDGDVYELTIDRMLLKSKESPKEDGLPRPAIEPANGKCTQIGNFATQHVKSVSCAASDSKGSKYEFQFESDGSPISVKMIRVENPEEQEQRAKALAAHIEQLKCRNLAATQGILPRDRTEFILRCMEEERPDEPDE
jgi:hypothetical protein